MAYLGARPTTNFRVTPTKDTFTGDGSTTTFDLANKVPAGGENALQVFVENVRQEPGSGKAYTLGADGSGDLKRITFSSAPISSAEIYVITTFSNEAFAKIEDLKGSEFVLDADGDTTITADTDDQIDIKIAGADDFQFTANTFTAQTGSSIVAPEGGLTLGSTAIGSTAAELNLLDGSAKSTSSITVADADALIVIDGSTTKQIPASDIKTYAGFTVSSITGATELAATPADTDEFVISDGGVLKRIDYNKINNFRKIHTITASDDATVTFNSTYLTSTFKRYTLEMFDIQSATDNVYYQVEFSTDNGSSYLTSSIDRINIGTTTDEGNDAIKSRNTNGNNILQMGGGTNFGTGTGEVGAFTMQLVNFSDTAHYKLVYYTGAKVNHDNKGGIEFGAGAIRTTSAINNIKFSFSSGNITAGTFNLYGID